MDREGSETDKLVRAGNSIVPALLKVSRLRSVILYTDVDIR